jgi:hypothetical protein
MQSICWDLSTETRSLLLMERHALARPFASTHLIVRTCSVPQAMVLEQCSCDDIMVAGRKRSRTFTLRWVVPSFFFSCLVARAKRPNASMQTLHPLTPNQSNSSLHHSHRHRHQIYTTVLLIIVGSHRRTHSARHLKASLSCPSNFQFLPTTFLLPSSSTFRHAPSS